MKNGTAPWQKNWSNNSSAFNAVTGNYYKGINSILLSIEGNRLSPNGDLRWATKKPAETKGWSIKLGAKPTKIYVQLYTEQKDEFGHTIMIKHGQPKKRFLSKTFEVFHASQIRGIPPFIRIENKSLINNQVIDEIVFNSSARIFEGGNEASYSPSSDLIRMPYKRDFVDIESYYSTLLHELSHWTGHYSRLDRFITYSKSSKDYAREELIAEIASMFLSAETGLKQTKEHFNNHASYVNSWISLLESSTNEIFSASQEAKKAADFILAFRNEEFEKVKLAS